MNALATGGEEVGGSEPRKMSHVTYVIESYNAIMIRYSIFVIGRSVQWSDIDRKRL